MSLLNTAADASPARRASIEAEMLSAIPPPQSSAPAGTAPCRTKTTATVKTRATYVETSCWTTFGEPDGAVAVATGWCSATVTAHQPGAQKNARPAKGPLALKPYSVRLPLMLNTKKTFETVHPRRMCAWFLALKSVKSFTQTTQLPWNPTTFLVRPPHLES